MRPKTSPGSATSYLIPNDWGVYVDEASFRQSPTLHQTWAPRNLRPEIPTLGQRNAQKILGAVSLEPKPRFAYRHQTEYFNRFTYRSFVQEVALPSYYRRGHRVYLIQDNASYHTHPEVWAWFQQERRRLKVVPLPKYSPELNAQERLWRYTRREATHNRFFETPTELCTSLFTTFREMQKYPESIQGLLEPFF
jgi:transposase